MYKLLLISLIVFSVSEANAQGGPAAHITSGSSLPSRCSPKNGDIFVVVTGSAGAAYTCTSINTWTAIASSNASTTVNGQTCALGSTCTISTGSAFSTVADASPIAWSLGSNFITNGTVTLAHLTATRALNVSNLVNGGFYTLIVKQDSTGGAAMTGGTGCTWLTPGGLASGSFAIATTASAINIISFTYDGTNCLVIPAAAYSAM